MGKHETAKRHSNRKAVPVAIGAPPGTLQIPPDAHPSRISLIAYGPDAFEEKQITDVGELAPYRDRWAVVWVNIDGLGSEAVLRAVADLFSIHPLALEDIVNIRQRPKMEVYADNLFITARMVLPGDPQHPEQVSLVLGRGYLLTFQERPGDCLEPVRNRIRSAGSQVRKQGADFLCYALLDAIVEGYFPLLEELGDELDEIQSRLIESPETEAVNRLHELRRQLRSLRRALWPLRDVLNSLCRDVSPWITEGVRIFFRDAHDQVIQVVDLIETYREMAGDLTDLYLSSLSNRMNEVMKVLTIIATIFMPLTFIAGIYGMNFNPERSPWNMPELNWYFGYPFALLLMALAACGMWYFFRRRGWVGQRRPAENKS